MKIQKVMRIIWVSVLYTACSPSYAILSPYSHIPISSYPEDIKLCEGGTCNIVSLHPQHLALKKLLAHYQSQIKRGEQKVPWVSLPYGAPDRNTSRLCTRLFQHGYLPEDKSTKQTFDSEIEEALKVFQRCHALSETGRLDRETVDCLNKPLAQFMGKIKNSISHWEKIGACEAGRNLVINIPSFDLRIFDGGKEALYSRVVVGMRQHKTPELSSCIKHVVLHPSWHIPPRLDKAGRHVVGPGPRNPLGPIKCPFSNDYSIVLHGTTMPHLFSRNDRACSNGCVRAQEIKKIALFLLKGVLDEPTLSRHLSRIRTREFRVQNPMPIYIVYATVWMDDRGRPKFLKDVYNKHG